MPIAFSSLRMLRVDSVSSIKELSVISSFKLRGCNWVSCKICLTWATKWGWANCLLEILTLVFQSAICSNCNCQIRICQQASLSTNEPRGTIKPVSSAKGINSPGGTKPFTGCCQRTRTSKPRILLSAKDTIGW